MKMFWQYIKAIWQNEDDIYSEQNHNLKEALILFSIFFITTIGLITPFGRNLLRWLMYLCAFSFAVSSGVFVLSYIGYFVKGYRRYKILLAAGSSMEEEEKNRRKLCEMEGDDALEATESQKHVYFLDFDAMACYANALYGCFLSQQFDIGYMKLEDGAVLYTIQSELDKLKLAESNKTGVKGPFVGYADFIRPHFNVLPDSYKEDLAFMHANGMVDLAVTDAEMNVAIAIQLQNDEDAEIVILSSSEEVKEIATTNGIACCEPFKVDTKE